MPERRWAEEHGADGLRRKFDVYKSRDGVDLSGVSELPDRRGTIYPDGSRVGADGEFIFVLRPETDREAWAALLLYAHAVAYRAPQLADEISRHLNRIGENQHA